MCSIALAWKNISKRRKSICLSAAAIPLAIASRAPRRRPLPHWLSLQRQDGSYYVGVVLPVGRLRSDQLRALADIADRLWQRRHPTYGLAKSAYLRHRPSRHSRSNARSSGGADLVRHQCAGRPGRLHRQRAAASSRLPNTKCHAWRGRIPRRTAELDEPINIHLTGCPHLVRPALHRRHRPLGTKVPRATKDRRLSPIPRRRLRRQAGNRPANCG